MSKHKSVHKVKNTPPPPLPETNRLSRRSFLQLGLGALSTAAALELGAAGLLYLRARSLEGRFGGVITAGPLEEFQPGSVHEYTEGNFFLVCTEDDGFLAVHRRCPHLGCTVNWDAQSEKFYCPCHASSFDAHGEYQNELVSRSLDTFQVFFEDGMVKVDTSQVLVRQHYTPEQIRYRREASG